MKLSSLILKSKELSEKAWAVKCKNCDGTGEISEWSPGGMWLSAYTCNDCCGFKSSDFLTHAANTHDMLIAMLEKCMGALECYSELDENASVARQTLAEIEEMCRE